MRRMLILLAVVGVLGAGANVYRSNAATEQAAVCDMTCDPSDCDPRDCLPMCNK